MTFFGPEIGSGFGELRHTPTKNSREYPPRESYLGAWSYYMQRTPLY